MKKADRTYEPTQDGGTLLALRDHPFMRHRGARNWPPVWTGVRRGRNTVRGELGVLKQVIGDQRSTTRFSLVIDQQGKRYIGTVSFDDEVFGWLIAQVLRSHIGWTIKDIGSLDLSFTLLNSRVAGDRKEGSLRMSGSSARPSLAEI